MSDIENNGTERIVVVSCAGCENRYLKENATVLSETVVDGEVVDPDDDLERCPYCGQTAESSTRLGVNLDRSVDSDTEHSGGDS